ncbi:OPT oligopeptide transporter protein-domain-containing protein [Blyttiomyces helicus]|uniref:OPT oligopeptide transporter protein-domain-containing protein n=1 Tax=Blyttiomyces helicus TaxID=388810 RepID=A0A4P9WL25_9FUNG|nr:OPT oligopeptide transporter protein-domain-containing protein [Blyttiomyces helicus]|eukprot:RKO93544.1 OPT oligopeptide transporter protein-domain-containing protein [Blyttiomyces helicus]
MEKVENQSVRESQIKVAFPDDTSSIMDAASFRFGEVEFPGEQSSIPEVAVTIPVSDDPTLPCLTFRFWVLSTIFSILAAAVASFNFLRYNQIALTTFAFILMSYPCGQLMAKVLPSWKIGFHWPSDFLFARGTFIGGSLNPGPFNVKEQTLIIVACSTNLSSAYALDVLSVQRYFFGAKQNADVPDPEGMNVGWAASMLFLWTSQCLGYSLAGLCRSWLVYPAAMWWPSNLVTANLLHIFHSDSQQDIIRERLALFKTITMVTVVYELLPQFFAGYLSRISIICLALGGASGKLGIASDYPPVGSNPPTVAQVFGMFGGRGAGVGLITLDWAGISQLGPLYTPFWAQMNVMSSLILSAWIFTPILFAANFWNAKSYPITATNTFDNKFNRYDVSRVIDLHTHDVIAAEYEAYSPLMLNPAWAIVYAAGFAALSATLVHVFLFHGQEVADGFRRSRNTGSEDVHVKMMRKYPEVPFTWYLATLVIFAALSLSSSSSTGTPSSACVERGEKKPTTSPRKPPESLSHRFAYPPPPHRSGIILAISNTPIGTNIITELLYDLRLQLPLPGAVSGV